MKCLQLFFLLAGLSWSCGGEASLEGVAGNGPFAGQRLEIFVGSASQPPMAEVAQLFEEETGAALDLHFGGSGAMLSQMALTERGDIYIPGSSDYMALAADKELVDIETEVHVAFLVPSILVPAGNPAGITALEDLAREGLRVGIARPDTVCVGLYAVEILERAGLSESVRQNIVTHAESCAKTAQLIATGQVDAVLGWQVFAAWNAEAIEAVPLAEGQVSRLGVIPAARSRFAREPELADAFLAFLDSNEARKLFAAHGYSTREEELRAALSENTPIGGIWELPESWRP